MLGVVVQLSEGGRKKITLMDADNWPLVSASALPYLPNISQTPVELSEAQMTTVIDQFVAAAKRAGLVLTGLNCKPGTVIYCRVLFLIN